MKTIRAPYEGKPHVRCDEGEMEQDLLWQGAGVCKPSSETDRAEMPRSRLAPRHLPTLPAWICDLMQHGLLKPSFIPSRPQRELRELIRYRISLIQERGDEANRIQKVLEGGNIKLGSVVSDILGKSGRAILTAIAAGTGTPEEMAAMADCRLRATPEELVKALQGRLTDHQRTMLQMQLDHVRYLDQQIERLDTEVAKRLAPFEAQLKQLDTIPGVNQSTAESMVAVIGTDMTRFLNQREPDPPCHPHAGGPRSRAQ